MEFSVKVCHACEEEIDDDHVGPCPYCNGPKTTLIVSFLGGEGVAMNERGIAMQYGDQDRQPWQEKWHRMRAALKLLKEHYEGGNFPGNTRVARDVEDFFEECFHLGDWIWEDETDPAKQKELMKEIKEFILADPDLRICEGIANTTKHRTRRKPGNVLAWVDSVTHNNETDKTDAVIKWKTNQDSGEVDALELAKRCYTAWRTYQRANGLKTVPATGELATQDISSMAVNFVVKPLMKGAADTEWLFYVYLDEGWVSATSEMFATGDLTEQAAKTIIEDARRGPLSFELNYARQAEKYCARIMSSGAYLAMTGPMTRLRK